MWSSFLLIDTLVSDWLGHNLDHSKIGFYQNLTREHQRVHFTLLQLNATCEPNNDPTQTERLLVLEKARNIYNNNLSIELFSTITTGTL